MGAPAQCCTLPGTLRLVGQAFLHKLLSLIAGQILGFGILVTRRHCALLEAPDAAFTGLAERHPFMNALADRLCLPP